MSVIQVDMSEAGPSIKAIQTLMMSGVLTKQGEVKSLIERCIPMFRVIHKRPVLRLLQGGG